MLSSAQKIILLAILSALALYYGLSHLLEVDKAISATAAITFLTAVLWVSEALPIPVTSLIPFVLLPASGVLSYQQAASALGSHVILLLMGAFMLSKSLERSQVHKRLAIYMISIAGKDSSKGLVLGFMFAAAILSMWISNTATTLMLIPIALAVLSYTTDKKLTIALILGIAYSASLGGVGTPIGTPPNIIFLSVYQETQGIDMGFIEWMKTGVPIVLLGIPVIGLWLTRGIESKQNFKLPTLKNWQQAEIRVLLAFGFIALAWIFRKSWTEMFDMQTVGDSTIALAGVVLMFLIPNGKLDESGNKQYLLDWKSASDIPWGMLLLFAGGICIAKGFESSGLSELLGNSLTILADLPVYLMILGICLFVTFVTEITSNTATATLLMPILAVVGSSMGVDPKLLMIPAAISASCAFMLPVATAPNAIAYSTDAFSIKDMVREGLVLNVFIAIIAASVCYLTLQ